MSDSDEIELSEDELALDFAETHPGHRWVDVWGRWMTWTGTHWEFDSTLKVYDLVRTFIRDSSYLFEEPSKVRRAQTVAAVERLARSDRKYAATTDQWDAEPWLLNTPSGVVDLRTGELQPHDSSRYFTKITGVGIDRRNAPAWRQFMDEITQDDCQLAEYLQRFIGYCLTGDTSEHVLGFLHGGGANGKSTFLNVITRVLGDYAKPAPMETFTASQSERHPTDLAMLRGARLVTAVETEEGRKWAESKIKALTGGDPITARFMRQDFFTFTPQFKLLIAGNHKPRLNAVDEAMRRRFHLIPFEASFKGERRVTDMEARLMAEAPQILEWAIDGCLDWQETGLAPPQCVTEATEHYFANQDTLSEWRAEKCETGPGYWETPSRLFASWKQYAKAAEIPVGTRASFNDRMESAGFRQARDRTRGRYWEGVRLRPDAEASFRDWHEAGS